MTTSRRIALIGLAIIAMQTAGCHRAHRVPLTGINSILVAKKDHTLTLFHGTHPVRTYQIALGRGGLGPKLQAGDNRVPEGLYRIENHNPHSAFHLALRISYPTPAQQQQAQAQHLQPGGDIMIHGIRNGLGWLGPLQHRIDWTKGCIALTDPEIDEIYNAVPDGTPILITP